MDIKKIALTGSCAVALAMLGACSDDSSSGSDPVVENASSSSVTMITSVDSQGNEVQVPASSASAPTKISSSSVEAGVTYLNITEIMYNAPENSELEWVELTITDGPGLSDMMMYQLRLDGAISYAFPAEPLTPGEYIVVTNNVELFKQTYKDFAGRVFGPWDKDETGSVAKLSNEGDVIDVKLTGKGDVSCSYSKEPPWPSLANGKGRSLVFKGGNAAQSSSWGASKLLLGNPGVGPDEWLEVSHVRINEIMPTSAQGDAWVELYNAGSEPVDVAGWTFESKVRNEKMTIKAGVVPAQGYLVLDGAKDFSEELVVSPIGGSYYLYGLVEGDESSLLLPSSGLSSGIVDLSDGSIAQGALKEATPGAANSALYVGAIVINEINYHPNEDDPNQLEFLELKNLSAVDVSLYGTVNGKSKGWKIEGINKEFATGDVIPANGLMVLFPDSVKNAIGETGVRVRYSIPDAVPVRFYSGKLSNRGETIAVKAPYTYTTGTSSADIQWYFDWSDATLYSDSWSGAGVDYKKADGYGASLQRVDITTMGYEASAWTVGDPTPGK